MVSGRGSRSGTQELTGGGTAIGTPWMSMLSMQASVWLPVVWVAPSGSQGSPVEIGPLTRLIRFASGLGGLTSASGSANGKGIRSLPVGSSYG